MKKIMTAALALALLGGTAAQAQPWDGRYGGGDRDYGRYDRSDRYDRYDRYDRRDDRRDYRRDYRDDRRDYRRWSRGQRIPQSYWGYGVDYRSHRGLRRPPNGYRWVRYNDDYILAAVATGLILEVIAGGR